MKADLHCHTVVSRDSLSLQEDIVAACQRKMIDCLAVTDHNRLTVWREDRLKLIPGEEVMTTAGEIIGLFLIHEIPPNLAPLETVRRIKAQGGLVCVPHPFDRFRRRSALRPAALAEIAPEVDLVEGLNARNICPRDDFRAMQWAQANGLPVSAGSDAHWPGEIGTAYVELDDFASASEFLSRLRQSSIGGGHSWPWVHLLTTWAKLRKRR